MLTAAGLASALAEETGITQTDVRHMLDELKNLTLRELADGHRVKLVGLVQLEPKIRPARKARMGRNPRTGEQVEISAKPAESVVRARVLAEAKGAAPSVRKLSEALGVPDPGTKVPKDDPAPRKAKKKVRAKAKNKH